MLRAVVKSGTINDSIGTIKSATANSFTMTLNLFDYDMVDVVYFSQFLKSLIFGAPIENLKWFFF